MFQKVKELFHKLKTCLLPPSSKSFHERMDKLEQLISAPAAYKNTNGLKFIEAMSYTLLHQGMEQRLRDKVRRGGKVTVFFLVQSIAKFECKSIYEAMNKSELFEPYVLITHTRDKQFMKESSFIEETRRAYQIMIRHGYRTILGYDDKWRPIQLERFRPDIIFWNNPNMAALSHYQNLYLNANYLTCYTNYFYDTVNLKSRDRFAYQLENFQIMTTWKHFVESYPTFYSMTEKSRPGLLNCAKRPDHWLAVNAVLSGYPKLDPYGKDSPPSIPEKINNGKPIVICAPHWSIRCGINFATFHLYHQQFIDLVKNYPDINFVYKPHPELRNRIIDLHNAKRDDTLTPDEYDAYVKEWDALPNGIYIDDGEYIDLFKASTCLITDCGSFIAEYLPSGHPCIYILNPEKKDPLAFFNEFGQKVINSYYCCSDWKSIESYFEDIVLYGNDPNKEQRQQIAEEAFLNIGSAGQYICNYIEHILTE